MGGYLRLSEFTEQPMSQIWREKGDLAILSFPDLRPGEFLVSLSLLHDPCPYLTEENSCDVYPVRPTDCAGFPQFELVNGKEQLPAFENYQCMQGVKLSSEQATLVRKLQKTIMLREAQMDIDLLWSGQPLYIYAPTLSHLHEFITQASVLQKQRDPSGISKRTQKLFNAMEIVNAHQSTGGRPTFSFNEYTNLLSSVMFCLLEDRVADRFNDSEARIRSLYKKTTKKWQALHTRF